MAYDVIVTNRVLYTQLLVAVFPLFRVVSHQTVSHNKIFVTFHFCARNIRNVKKIWPPIMPLFYNMLHRTHMVASRAMYDFIKTRDKRRQHNHGFTRQGWLV